MNGECATFIVPCMGLTDTDMAVQQLDGKLY